jgi:diaminopimelate epimerase
MIVSLQFSKYQGLGNDFILIDAAHLDISKEYLKLKASILCDRRFGIGADGVILVLPSQRADFAMFVINSDGSVPEMCGNGLRCLAAYCFDNGLTKKLEFTVETAAGILTAKLTVSKNHVDAVTVNMGNPQFDADIHDNEQSLVQKRQISVAGQELETFAVSMGNPHAVIFNAKNSSNEIFNQIGAALQSHANFPKGVNVGLARVIDSSHIDLVVWERGAGLTLACGTGACAAVVAAVSNRLCDREVAVKLPGGSLTIVWDESTNYVFMSGPAELVYQGTIIV